MARHPEERWAVILAGGDGARLRPLTQLLSGDQRPKQFCRILGQSTLVAETAARLSQTMAPASMLFVVSRHHEPFYRDELQHVPAPLVVQQPVNRGTTAAVAAALMRIRSLAASADPLIGFFPADHSYADGAALNRALARAFAGARTPVRRVVLLGARATAPNTDFGWIEPGDELPARARSLPMVGRVHAVKTFLEKPSAEQAVRLFDEGWWWNTFVSVGRASAFAELLAKAVPHIWGPFETVAAAPLVRHTQMVRMLYATLPMSDFSRDVLTTQPHRLAVVGPLEAGWTDLGHPHRVLQTMALRGVPRPTLLRRAVS
jgi:mannose-1-phosphate guanylyltransferase